MCTLHSSYVMHFEREVVKSLSGYVLKHVWILHKHLWGEGKEWSLLISLSNICAYEQRSGHIIMSSYKLKCPAANRAGI